MKKTVLMVAAALMSCMTGAWAQTEVTETAKCGEIVTITATPDAGYKFLYWDDDHSKTEATRDVLIDENTTIFDYVAVFEAVDYTIAVAVKEEGTGSVEQSSFSGNKGSKITLKAIESENCYQFKEWQDADGNTLSTDKEYEYEINADATVYAVFVAREFTVKASTTGNGTVTIAKK